jgi:thiol-disulfide isomerase/thioredoxin
LFTEKAVFSALDKVSNSLSGKYFISPTIYHRIIKGDSIINYIAFNVKLGASVADKKFKFEFVQDSIFLLLNKKLPDFKLEDLDGKKFDSKNLNKKPTLINYWSIQCKPCIEEIPKLNELQEKYGDKMNFIAISPSLCERDKTLKFLEKKPFNFIQLEEISYAKNKLKNNTMPRNIFVDRNGFVRYIQGNFPYDIDKATGDKIYSENNYFIKIIEELIKQK